MVEVVDAHEDVDVRRLSHAWLRMIEPPGGDALEHQEFDVGALEQAPDLEQHVLEPQTVDCEPRGKLRHRRLEDLAARQRTIRGRRDHLWQQPVIREQRR